MKQNTKKIMMEKPLFHAGFFNFGFLHAQTQQRRGVFDFVCDGCWVFRIVDARLRAEYTLR